MQQCPARRADFLERSRASLSRRERPWQPQFLPSHTLDTPLYGSSYTRVSGLVTSPLYLSVRHSKLPCTEQWCPGTLSPSLAFLSNAKNQRKGERCIERVRSFRARNRQEDPKGSVHKHNGGTCVPALSGTGSMATSHLPTSASSCLLRGSHLLPGPMGQSYGFRCLG